MKPAYENAAAMTVRPGVRRYAHRPRGAVLLLVLVASMTALLPNAAQAHQPGAAGLNGARLNINPDGYNEGFYMEGRSYEVTGTGFIKNTFAEIFQCAVTSQANLHRDCQLLGVAPTDENGNFPPTSVYMRQTFTSVSNPLWPSFTAVDPTKPGSNLQGTEVGGTTCFGRLGVQCAVVAATFGRTAATPPDVVPMSRAEHYICFEGTSTSGNPPVPDALCQTRPT